MALGKQLIELDFLEDGNAQQLQDCVEAGGRREPLLDDGNEHVDRNRDPDLGFHGVLGETKERLDAGSA